MSHLGVLGMTGMGKSHLLKFKLMPAWPCVVACDPNDEHSVYGQEKPDRPLGKLRERMTASQLARDPWKLLEDDLQLAVVPDRIGSVESEAQCFDLVARLLIRSAPNMVRGHKIRLVVDECAQAFQKLEAMNKKKPEQATSPAERLTMLATRGVTHLDVSMVVSTQRPNLLPTNVRGNLDQVIYFKLPEAIDLDGVRRKAGKEFAERVRQLEPRKFIVWRATAPTPRELPPDAAQETGAVTDVEAQPS